MGLATEKYHGLIKQTQGNTVYHVEHILSRNSENISWFESEDEFEDYRNRLGALTLLKGPDNQSSGNESFEDKLKTYMSVGSLWAKTLVPDFKHSNTGYKNFCKDNNISFNTFERYDVNAVKERFSLLMKIIRLIWE